jgi:hypothetical protein
VAASGLGALTPGAAVEHESRIKSADGDITRLEEIPAHPAQAEDWLERLSGSFENEPAFEEVLRLGREIRKADAPND